MLDKRSNEKWLSAEAEEFQQVKGYISLLNSIHNISVPTKITRNGNTKEFSTNINHVKVHPNEILMFTHNNIGIGKFSKIINKQSLSYHLNFLGVVFLKLFYGILFFRSVMIVIINKLSSKCRLFNLQYAHSSYLEYLLFYVHVSISII